MLPPSPTTKLVFLGTGTPNPDPKHLGPAAAVVVDGQPYIVDCGAGLVRQARAAGLEMEQLTHAFITHLHSDHTIGLPDLIFTPAVTGRLGPLNIWGPVGTKRMVENILGAWSEDIDTRLHGGEPAVPEAYGVEVKEISEGPIFKDENVEVSAFAVEHGRWRHAYGLKFKTPDRTIIFSGDTTYCQNLIDHAKGCDILVHEAYSQKGLDERTPEWQAYHSSYHTSGPDLGRIASKVKPKLLLLYHVLPFGQPEGQVVAEVQTNFSGDVREAEDLEVY